jgi:hypothetical protein
MDGWGEERAFLSIDYNNKKIWRILIVIKLGLRIIWLKDAIIGLSNA